MPCCIIWGPRTLMDVAIGASPQAAAAPTTIAVGPADPAQGPDQAQSPG